MNENVRLVQFDRSERRREGLMKFLDELKAKVESGEVVGVSILAFADDGDFDHWRMGKYAAEDLGLIGALELVKLNIAMGEENAEGETIQ